MTIIYIIIRSILKIRGQVIIFSGSRCQASRSVIKNHDRDSRITQIQGTKTIDFNLGLTKRD